MKKKTLFGLIGLTVLPATSIFTFGWMVIANAQVSPSAQSQPATHPSLASLQQNVGEIVTPEGTYIRTNKALSTLNIPKDAIAFSKNDVSKPGIQAIVLPYGVFIKTDQAGEKAFQQQWIKDRPTPWTDQTK